MPAALLLFLLLQYVVAGGDSRLQKLSMVRPWYHPSSPRRHLRSGFDQITCGRMPNGFPFRGHQINSTSAMISTNAGPS